MTKEEKNKEKRKNIPLTIGEWLGFFFIPFNDRYNPLGNQFSFNNTELERFRKFGFQKKLEQSSEVRKYGVIFYIFLVIILVIIFN